MKTKTSMKSKKLNQLKDQNVKNNYIKNNEGQQDKEEQTKITISSGSDIGLNSPNHHRQTEEKKASEKNKKGSTLRFQFNWMKWKWK